MSAVASSGVSKRAATRRTRGATAAKAAAAARVAAAITTAIDRPLTLPPSPTSTLPDAPTARRTVPKYADAVPAMPGCSERASAVESGPTAPTGGDQHEERDRHGDEPETADEGHAQQREPGEHRRDKAGSGRRWGVNRPRRRWFSWLAASMPTAFTLKRAPKTAGEAPYVSW